MKEIWSDPDLLSQVNSLFPGCAVPLQPYQHALCTETAPWQCLRDPPPRAPLLPEGFPRSPFWCLTLLPLLGKVIRAAILNKLWRELTKDIREVLPVHVLPGRSEPHLPHYDLGSPSSIKKIKFICCFICHFCLLLREGTGSAICCGQSEGTRVCNEE